MLDPHYLQQIADGAENIASQLHEYIIRQIVDRMMIRIGRGDDYLLTSSDAWRIQVLQDSGYLLQDITEELAKYTKRQEKEMREILDSMTRPYELRVQEGGRPSEAVGMIDLTIKADRPSKLISLPNDKEFRAEMATNRKTGKKASGDEFLGKKADDALARLRAMNE